MAKAMDFTKLRKNITKSIPNISVGFHDPTVWISTGNYCLNYRISGDFFKGVPLGKVTMLAGESGAGKSYIASGNLTREAQKQGIFVVLIDTENALDEEWLQRIGVDTSEDKLLRVSVAMVDDVAKLISDFMKDYRAQYKDADREDRPKVLFVVDSLGMLLTPTDVDQFEKGDMKGDMGRKAKALTALIRNCVNMFGEFEVGMIATNHSYQSQDMFSPDPVISGGQGMIYASSIVVAMQKLKLKEDEDGNKTSQVNGIRAKCRVLKTRYAKPFEDVEIKIPFNTGMNPYSGLFEMFEASGLVVREGNKFKYVALDGTEHKLWRKEYERNENGILDLIMSEYKQSPEETNQSMEDSFDETEGEESFVDEVDEAV